MRGVWAQDGRVEAPPQKRKGLESKRDVVAVVAQSAIADAGAINGEGVVEVTTCGDDAIRGDGHGFERGRGSVGAVEHLGVRSDERLDQHVRGGFEQDQRGELGVDEEGHGAD